MNGNARAIREELLARHSELRAAADEIRVAVHRVRGGDGAADELHQALRSLATALHKHSLHEDEVLADVIRTVDAWGDVRAEVLADAHASERRELQDGIATVLATNDIDRLLAVTLGCVERLLEHFAREERLVLAEDVLSDDIVPRNSFCG